MSFHLLHSLDETSTSFNEGQGPSPELSPIGVSVDSQGSGKQDEGKRRLGYNVIQR